MFLHALVREFHGLPDHVPIVFLEVERTDASEFNQRLLVEGKRIGNHCVLHARSPMVSNSIAALLIHIERTTRRVPYIYFKWKEGNPVAKIRSSAKAMRLHSPTRCCVESFLTLRTDPSSTSAEATTCKALGNLEMKGVRDPAAAVDRGTAVLYFRSYMDVESPSVTTAA